MTDRDPSKPKDVARHVVEYALSCGRNNTDEWMDGLADVINEWAASIGEEDRVEYVAKRGAFRIVKGGA